MKSGSFSRLAVSASMLLMSSVALAAPAALQERTLCVFDPSGANGDAYNTAKAYQAEALNWGISLVLKPYTDEKACTDDLKAGVCDAASITGARARPFGLFAPTVEALGGLRSYEDLHEVMKTLASPKASSLMREGDYETLAVIPGGAVYLFLRDRKATAVEDLVGKRIAALAHDEAARVLISQIGGSMVAADVGTFAGMFNNGSVDVCYAPAVAYAPLELGRGLKNGGGVVRYPITQMTMQMVGRHKRFPADFGEKMRAFSAQRFDKSLAMVKEAEGKIPTQYWVEAQKKDLERYEDLLTNVRVRLRDNEKVYNPTMLTLMRRVRCQRDATRAECALKRE